MDCAPHILWLHSCAETQTLLPPSNGGTDGPSGENRHRTAPLSSFVLMRKVPHCRLGAHSISGLWSQEPWAGLQYGPAVASSPGILATGLPLSPPSALLGVAFSSCPNLLNGHSNPFLAAYKLHFASALLLFLVFSICCAEIS